VSGFLAPLPVRPLACSPLAISPPGSFAPWLVRPLADSPPGSFAPWLVRPLAILRFVAFISTVNHGQITGNGRVKFFVRVSFDIIVIFVSNLSHENVNIWVLVQNASFYCTLFTLISELIF